MVQLFTLDSIHHGEIYLVPRMGEGKHWRSSSTEIDHFTRTSNLHFNFPTSQFIFTLSFFLSFLLRLTLARDRFNLHPSLRSVPSSHYSLPHYDPSLPPYITSQSPSFAPPARLHPSKTLPPPCSSTCTCWPRKVKKD